MIRPASGIQTTAGTGRTLGLWFASGASLLWRVPLFLLLIVLSGWFAFRGLVHLAFLFEAHPIGTFIFAPALLPFAALPAVCFLLVIRFLPRIWRDRALSAGRKTLTIAGGPLAALLAAQLIDLVQTNMIKLMGIRLPRLPLDPY